MYAVCQRIIGNASVAEEATQDVLLKIYTRLDQYREDDCFEAWMQRIAVHTAIDYLRRQYPGEETLPENYPDEPEEETGTDDTEYTVQKIKDGLTELAPGYRIILSLYLFEGYDMEEIAQILHIRPVTVRTQYLRAKKKLKELITCHPYG